MLHVLIATSNDYLNPFLQIRARTAGASKSIEVEVDKPLGLTLGQKSGGGVIITVSFLSECV